MTNHPLHDEILWTLYANIPGDLSQKFEHRLARSAADWQLDQVIEWIKECPNYDLDFHSECRRMIEDLKKAMRPQEDN